MSAGWFKHLSFRCKHFHGGRYFGELLHSRWGSSTVVVTQWSASICLRCPARFVHAWNGPPHNRTHVRLTGRSPHRAEKAGKSADSILWPADWCMSGFFLVFFHFLVVLHYLLCIFKARLGRVVGSSFKLVWIKCSVFVCQDTYMLRDVNTMQWWVIANSLSRLPFNGLTWEDVRYWDYNGTCAPRLIYSDDVHGSHEYFELISCACKPRDPASKITANSVN